MALGFVSHFERGLGLFDRHIEFFVGENAAHNFSGVSKGKESAGSHLASRTVRRIFHVNQQQS